MPPIEIWLGAMELESALPDDRRYGPPAAGTAVGAIRRLLGAALIAAGRALAGSEPARPTIVAGR